jgi:hypothetical protein
MENLFQYFYTSKQAINNVTPSVFKSILIRPSTLFTSILHCLSSLTSHLTPHTSHLTPHTSYLTLHTSHLTPDSYCIIHAPTVTLLVSSINMAPPFSLIFL